MVIFASEDVGLADPVALSVATAAAHAVEYVGLPEARINLSHAAIYLALERSHAEFVLPHALLFGLQFELHGHDLAGLAHVERHFVFLRFVHTIGCA